MRSGLQHRFPSIRILSGMTVILYIGNRRSNQLDDVSTRAAQNPLSAGKPSGYASGGA